MSKAWPQSLLDASVYPHAVDELKLIETHISWVILTGEFAYKIKKPVNLGFLDFSSLALRQHYCQRELELNRRFSRDLYLETVAITGSEQQPRIDGDGEAIDYAVKMRQFDNRFLADNLARNGQLTDDLVRQMATTLARIHTQLPSIDDDSPYGSAEDFYAGASENFTQIRAYTVPPASQQTLIGLQQWTDKAYQGHQTLLQQRRQQGFVKDCHGDCHLGNIVVLNNEVTLFDCIEFNDSFRIRDTLAEAAFLSMDLCARNLAGQSQRFINTYLEHRGDYEGLSLFNLYRCYYAMVRAKVNALQHSAQQHPTLTHASDDKFFHYVALAERFTRSPTPGLVLMHGLSGSGKSWLAERLMTQFNAIRIRSDVERKRLFQQLPEALENDATELYGKPMSRKTFERLLVLSQAIIRAGYCCFVDATFLSRSTREPFIDWALNTQVPLAIVHCEADEAVIKHRLDTRKAQGNDPSDADYAIYQRQKDNAEPFLTEEIPYLIRVDTDSQESIDDAVSKLRQRLAS